MSTLPVEHALPALRAALVTGTAAVLQAPPGAGKTTRVPLALLDEPWLARQSILMLEPRRLATRAAARYMAKLLGENVGDTVGYRVRLDSKVGPRTRVEVVTEGILTRRLQADPGLDGVGLVIFDEFHERSLNADLGLALTLQTQALLRHDLRILVMSATLDGAAVAALLGGAPIVTSEGRTWPVETRYLPRRSGTRMESAVAGTVSEALSQESGDVLVFLPGAGEIRRVESLLAERGLPDDITVAPLYGNLPQDAQDRAILPSPPGRRKVVLATPIAETSLTIEGVRAVIDSGFVRVPRFSPRSGMTRLETTRVSRASADQRRGRAGRVGPGVCYRLWDEAEESHLLPYAPPEILEADLAPLALELACAGVRDVGDLRWLTLPPEAALSQARELLREVDAVDPDHRATAHGRRMAGLGVHPRLAHMVIRGAEMSASRGWLACRVAALLEERDVLRGEGPVFPDADLRLRLEALGGAEFVRGWRVDRETVRRIRLQADHLARAVGLRKGADDDLDAAGILCALAYPDRVAQRRPGAGGAGRFLLRNGGGAAFPERQALSDEPMIVCADLDDARPERRIFLAAPVDPADVEREFASQIAVERTVEWDDASQAVVASVRQRLGAIVLRESPWQDVDAADVSRALVEAIRNAGVARLPWSEGALKLRQRLSFMHRADDTWPDVSDAALTSTMDEWLAPRLYGLRKGADVTRIDLADALLQMLTREQRRKLDDLAPTHVVVPTGSRIPVDYSDASAPALAVRLQEVFGMTETPKIGGGRVPVVMHLLSPAHRPVQVTRDLAGFWRTSYFDVKKEMKGRYPKHLWPDDPLTAAPTRRAKPRGT